MLDQHTGPSLLVLVRHGESMHNSAKGGSVHFADDHARQEVQGVADHHVPLTQRGWAQALRTGAALRERFGAPRCMYHSGFRRTRETAEAILQSYTTEECAHIQVRQTFLIRERDGGYTYGMTTGEARGAFPWLDDYWNSAGGFFARPPGGQSLADVAAQVLTFLTLAFREHAGEPIFVVTHGATLLCFRMLLEQWDYATAEAVIARGRPENCAVTAYRRAPTGNLSLEVNGECIA
ncbi:MAG: histidine phosphatase family protein [Thermoanaerobaculia bacterium]